MNSKSIIIISIVLLIAYILLDNTSTLKEELYIEPSMIRPHDGVPTNSVDTINAHYIF
mgnify:CR=1 FL=1